MDYISLAQIKSKLQRNNFLAHFSQRYFSAKLGNIYLKSTNEPSLFIQRNVINNIELRRIVFFFLLKELCSKSGEENK